MTLMKKIFTTLLMLTAVVAFAAAPVTKAGAAGNADNGKVVYEKRCWWCHGEEGDGEGPAAERLVPPPRDFTSMMFKFKSTPFDELSPTDEDLFKMISGERTHNSINFWTGMNDSSMPGWNDILSEQDIRDVAEYVKQLGELEPVEKGSISLAGQVPTSEESIAAGDKLFHEGDRCAECHGQRGQGDGTKKLKADRGYRTWPRNFTKGWSFRISNDPKDIYSRITIGIPGTPMPSFEDPEQGNKLTEEERWHVANYVASLDVPYKKPGDNTVIKAVKVEGELPTAGDDEAWAQVPYTSYYMVPQIIEEERYFTPSINSISVKALFNDTEVALLLEWDDRTKSVPGNKKAIEIAEREPTKDAVAVQFPVKMSEGTEKPYFGMGDKANPVNIWYWAGESETAGEGESVSLINSMGSKEMTRRDAAASGLTAKGAYDNGTWRVVMKRPLATDDTENDLQFMDGDFIPISFAAWDGSNLEKGSKHVLTAWYWLLLEPKTGSGVYGWPVLIALIVLGGEFLWLRSARKD